MDSSVLMDRNMSFSDNPPPIAAPDSPQARSFKAPMLDAAKPEPKLKSPRSKRIMGAAAASMFVSVRTTQDEISEHETKIEEAKSRLDDQLYLLRTQITRIEELERLVEAATNQLSAARRRRESEVTEMEIQRKQMQGQLERQLEDNRIAEAQLVAAQAKNAVTSNVIKNQVFSLTNAFSPHWTGNEIHKIVRDSTQAAGTTNSGGSENSEAFAANGSISAAPMSSSTTEMSSDAEAAAIGAVLNLRTREEIMADLLTWKHEKDREERLALAEKFRLSEQRKREEEEDRAAKELDERLKRLRRQYFPSADDTDEVSEDALTEKTPLPPLSPQAKLHQRYSMSAKRSLGQRIL